VKERGNYDMISGDLDMADLKDHCTKTGMLTSATGSCQEAHPPHDQVPACHRWCFPGGDQGAPLDAP